MPLPGLAETGIAQPMTDRTGFVLKGYPRLSETFIAQEIAGLEKAGLPLEIISLRAPPDKRRHPVHDEIRAAVTYLPEYIHQEPLRCLAAIIKAWRLPGFKAARKAFRADFARDRTRNRVRRFAQAAVLAVERGPHVSRLHAHFIHTPASVTRYAAQMLGCDWSCSAHAKDIWTTPEWEKREKLAACAWLVTCTAANRAHLAALAPPGRVELVYHGIDLARFPAPAAPRPARDGRDAADPVTLLSVGRLVEKKGTDVLLEALARLPRELHWRLVHAGGGPLRATLLQRARALGIAERIAWRGALAQDALLAEYRAADLFVLASRIARDGDRDGLPNVLVEAQSQGLACVSTAVSAIPELIEHARSGWLVPPESPDALAAALATLIGDPDRRAALGAAGQARVRAQFRLETNLERLVAKFGLPARHGVPRAEDIAHAE